MNFIKYQNQILNLEQICGVEFKKYSEEQEKIIGYSSRCSVFSSDGRETIFYNDNAEEVWTLLSSRCSQLLP